MPISWRETIVDSSNVSSWNYEYPSMITRVNSKRNLFMLWTGVSDISGCDKILRYGWINDAAGDPSGTDMDPSCVIRTPGATWNSDIGQYTSMEIDGSAVFITFTDWTVTGSEQLYFGYTPDGTRSDLSGGSWTFSAVEDDLKVEHVSLSIVNHKVAHISYYDVDNNNLKYAICEDATVVGPTWVTSNVKNGVVALPSGAGAFGSNIFADGSNVFVSWSSNEPIVNFSYTDESNPVSGSVKWSTLPVTSGGEYLSMAMSSIGTKENHKQYQAFLSYRKDSKLYYICNTDVLNNTWDISGEVHTDDPSDISIAISQRNPTDKNPRAYIAYKTNDEMKFVYTDNATTEPLGGTWTSSDISGTEYSSNYSLAVTGRNVYVTHFNARTYGGDIPFFSGDSDISNNNVTAGDKFQFIFRGYCGEPGSIGATTAVSTDIGYYNYHTNYVYWDPDVVASGGKTSLVDFQTWKDEFTNFFGQVCWKCIGSTETVAATDNIDYYLGNPANFKGVFDLCGNKVVNATEDLWKTHSSYPPGPFADLLHNLSITQRRTDDGVGWPVWCGTDPGGHSHGNEHLGTTTTLPGHADTRPRITCGRGHSVQFTWANTGVRYVHQDVAETVENVAHLYGLSEVLTWPPAGPIPARPGDLIINCWKVPVLETLQVGNF